MASYVFRGLLLLQVIIEWNVCLRTKECKGEIGSLDDTQKLRGRRGGREEGMLSESQQTQVEKVRMELLPTAAI